MRPILIIFFSVLTLCPCQQKTADKKQNEINENSNDFEITFDTLNMSIDGYLRKAVLFRDNFYGVFETDRKNASQSFKKMIVFDTKGNFIEDVFIPEEIQDMPHYDLVVENDSLYIKESQFEDLHLLMFIGRRGILTLVPVVHCSALIKYKNVILPEFQTKGT